ncbi:biotin/lipoate A/B protein ligase family protein [Blastopirellula marina]|uniref:Lipoate--protein ligase family protein n=1 Tax=Blastopirellula marina TaxID=124 RepID=A0A2S8F7R3_9BACT|nr:biotin/lipoate A/B protein ligase family protein [Blastopirellula marina]PQO28201.1 lipoate--protein ligase family protein [Blastopirellula marina]PTL41741.1 lipoate--protein ligase family protein [Blastopirellula marina]
MNEMRLIVDPPARGSWNMAVDEAILRNAESTGMPTLRFYQWSEPTLSLGYFQKYEDRWQHEASRDCACVRRASGGGAIMHDHELTYSFVAPVHDSRAEQFTRWFDIFHETLIDVLSNWGIDAHLSGNPQPGSPDDPFLCFQRRHEVDVIVDDYKVCGSAQRRHQVAILQHGSVLLHKSQAAPELPGLGDLTRRNISPGELTAAWSEAIKNKFQRSYVDKPLTSEEEVSAQAIEQEKFAGEAWTHKR